MLEVGGGDLQGVEHQAGGLGVDLIGDEQSHDLGERELDGVGVLENRKGERMIAAVAGAIGMESEKLFKLALVVIAETVVAHGGRSAPGAIDEQMQARVW